MKKTQQAGIIISLCVFLMAGCSNSIPEMDAETQELVVEYAAAAVRKHNEYQKTKLLEKQEIEEVAESEAVIEETEIVPENAELLPSQEETAEKQEVFAESEEGAADIKNQEEQESLTPKALESLLMLENVTFSYEGYETKEFYPDGGEDAYFVMNATDGNQLLVIKFQLENSTQEEVIVDLLDRNIRYKIDVNGETKNALTTMLLNDLSNYQDSIAPGEKKELVLIGEVLQEQAEQIESLSIIVKSADATSTILLN